MMELNEYTKEALRTESIIDSVSNMSAPSLYSSLLATGAIGDILDLIKKHIFYGKDIDYDRMNESIERAIDSLRDLRHDVDHDTITDGQKHEMFENQCGFYTDIGPQQLAHIDTRILHVVLGISTESAEIVQAMIRNIEGAPLDMINLSEEIGDINWYANGIFPDAAGIPYQKYLSANIAKLAVRYPDKFSSWLAHEENRNLVEERKVLESGTK
ncbi:hypothetical protein [Escherichia coli]|uniref:hypothetical protein n=1 Tax=Escherichia coli TaxID=562 RepID=UPI0030D44E82